MSNTYEYTGNPYENFSGSIDGKPASKYTSANYIVVTLEVPVPLPPGMALGDPLPKGTTLSISDQINSQSDLSPGENPENPYVGLDVEVSIQLSTDAAGGIDAWNIWVSFEFTGGYDPIPIDATINLFTIKVPGQDPSDKSSTENDEAGMFFTGSVDKPGTWVAS